MKRTLEDVVHYLRYNSITEAIYIISSYQNKNVSKRDVDITVSILTGEKKFSQCAKELGTSYERIRQIVFRTLYRYSPVHNKDELYRLNLTSRTYNALHRAGISTINAMIDVYENGDIENIRNLGKKGLKEIKTKIELYRRMING